MIERTGFGNRNMRAIRKDWFRSSSIGTILVGACFAFYWASSGESPDIADGALAIGCCYVLSMYTFLNRAFCRLPHECVLAKKPIFGETVIAFLAGLAYGTCISIGVTLAFVYVVRPTWDTDLVKYVFMAPLATAFIFGAAMLPFGWITGILCWLCQGKNANHEKSNDSAGGRDTGCAE